MKVNWLRMEKRIRYVLRNVGVADENKLRRVIVTIDEIIAHKTKRGSELSPDSLIESLIDPSDRAIRNAEWDDIAVEKNFAAYS